RKDPRPRRKTSDDVSKKIIDCGPRSSWNTRRHGDAEIAAPTKPTDSVGRGRVRTHSGTAGRKKYQPTPDGPPYRRDFGLTGGAIGRRRFLEAQASRTPATPRAFLRCAARVTFRRSTSRGRRAPPDPRRSAPRSESAARSPRTAGRAPSRGAAGA